MLRDRIQQNLIEEAQSVVQRAENTINSHRDHPMTSTLKNKTNELKSLMESGAGDNQIEETMGEIIQMLTSMEAAGS